MQLHRTAPRALALAALTLPLILATPTQGHTQEVDRDAFAYTGSVRTGSTVHIYNLNGAIEVERTSGSQVEVRAEKRWRRGNPDDVTIVQLEGNNGDLVVCALWNDAECRATGMSSRSKQRWNRDNDVSVRFTVRVPDGVHVRLSTVNGEVSVDRVSGDVEATTVNGSITAESTDGPVMASTVNGSIRASMGSTGREDLSYSTVNGSITLELPDRLDADVELGTVNGRVSTDYPITIQGTVSRKRLRGTLGDGGPRLKANTVNGSITLKRAG